MNVKVSTLIEVTSADGTSDPTPFDPEIDAVVNSVREAVEVALADHQGDGFSHRLQEQLSLQVQTVEACCVPEPQPSKQKIGIPARFSTGDGVGIAHFDAAPWFQQAGIEEILDLARDGWSDSYSGDEVAAWFDGKEANVTRVFDYIRAIQELPREVDCQGSDFSVEEEDVVKWLRKHRPDVAALLE